MSRIGKKKIEIPSGVQVKIDGSSITVKGPKAELCRQLHDSVNLEIVGSTLSVSVNSGDKSRNGIHGVTRTQINNMVIGVTDGFEKRLEIKGVGYKVLVKGNLLDFTLGFSHPVSFKLPEGIVAKADSPTLLVLSGADKGLVGQAAADIKALKAPEPYKGSGIRYQGEKLVRKEGKAGKKQA